MRSVLPSRESCDIFLAKITCLAAVYHEELQHVGSVEDFMASGLPGSGPDDFRLPAYLRFLVHCNSTRPMLVQLFSILQVESFNPAHPLHDEFANRRDSIWQYYSTYNWNLPSESPRLRRSGPRCACSGDHGWCATEVVTGAGH